MTSAVGGAYGAQTVEHRTSGRDFVCALVRTPCGVCHDLADTVWGVRLQVPRVPAILKRARSETAIERPGGLHAMSSCGSAGAA